MSMSKFEMNREEDDSSRLLSGDEQLPDDFSKEEMEFARELETLFVPDKEEFPPYFVQSLLEPDEPRFQPAERWFEQKTSARVFRRLKLRRHLFRHSRPSFPAMITPLPRPLRALVVACLLFIVFTMIASGPSFASGLTFLLSGAHSGVVQVIGYPKDLLSSRHSAKTHVSQPRPRQLSLYDVQQQLHFSMYWPLVMPDNYVLSDIFLYHQQQEGWADGPLLELNYTYSLPGVAAHGMGQISVFEFKPLGQVFQTVQLGSAHVVQLNRTSHAQATYVDGQWIRINRYAHSWLYGERAELIYEHSGIVFWIIGDQRDGIDSKVLLNIASSLQIFTVQRVMYREIGGRVNVVNEPGNDPNWLLSGDVVYSDSPNGSFFEVIGTDTPVQQQLKGGPRSN